MTTYTFTKDDGSTWLFFYDRYIRLWTVYETDYAGAQKGDADYFNNKSQMVAWHGFNFKTKEPCTTYTD